MADKKSISDEEMLLRREACRVMVDGQTEKISATLLKEHVLDIYLNGERWRKVVCTRTDLRAMVIGKLYTEGLVGSAADIEELHFPDEEDWVEIILKTVKKSDPVRTGSAQPHTPHPTWVFAIAKRLRSGMPLHRETFAAHSAFLARHGEILFACEDISRHNAVDKVIGLAVQNDIPLAQCMLFTSGRVPADMVKKAAAGIPVLVSKSMPTEDAVRLAAANGICLIGQLREDGFLVFPE